MNIEPSKIATTIKSDGTDIGTEIRLEDGQQIHATRIEWECKVGHVATARLYVPLAALEAKAPLTEILPDVQRLDFRGLRDILLQARDDGSIFVETSTIEAWASSILERHDLLLAVAHKEPTPEGEAKQCSETT